MKKYFFSITLSTVPFFFTNAQTFTKIPGIAIDYQQGNFPGCAWVDYDNDGDLDAFFGPKNMYANNNGSFTLVQTGLASGQLLPTTTTGAYGSGVSCADYDNDGDIDFFLAGLPSILYKNDGKGNFTAVNQSPISTADSLYGWSCAWADYDNDGILDISITNPQNFLPRNTPCILLKGSKDGSFIKVTGFDFTDNLAPYTTATWCDYDEDGDSDLFIASGPGGTPGIDRLYMNTLKENGKAGFKKITNIAPATDMQDGQCWNFIDTDNDGDLDAFITNWAGATSKYYKNNKGRYDSVFVTGQVAQQRSMSNAWGDVDNDGDLDVWVSILGTGKSILYVNDGNGNLTYTEVAGVTGGAGGIGASLGDYDKDGDLDLILAGPRMAIYRNENKNSNSWLILQCTGTKSNRSAIGARLIATTTINGKKVTQKREIQAGNTFGGHNALDVHFGLSNAEKVDELIILWPSGTKQVLKNVTKNQVLKVIEK